MHEKTVELGKKWVESVLPELRKTILQYYGKAGRSKETQLKSDNTPVTLADRQAESLLRDELAKSFPDHGVIGEEFGETNGGADFRWVLDPIDGTKSFIAGAPLFGTLMALLHMEEPVLGAIFLPVTNELLIGDNRETRLNGAPVSMAQEIPLEEALVVTTDERDFEKYKPRGGYDRLVAKARLARTWGDCFGYYLVATGGAHVMIDPMMSIWDKAALAPVIRGAGGAISDFYGNDAMSGDSIVASVASLHPQVIELLNT